MLLRWSGAGAVSAQAVWAWVQAAGRRAMAPRHEQLQAVAQGPLPTEEPLPTALAAAPLLMGADGVRVPLRPEGGQPRGTTAWHAVKVGVLARLGRHRTRPGTRVARRHQRRLVAVFGEIEALQQRRWLAAWRQGIRHASQVVWLSEGARGLGRLFAECFPASASGRLDLYHAGQPRWKRAAVWLDGRTPQARRWFGWARPRLRHGTPDGVLADLADALEVEGLPDTARDPRRTV